MQKYNQLFKKVLFLIPFLPLSAQAAFVESTLGNAVVNDASAVYYNPAGLTLLENKQIVLSESLASVYSRFKGEAQQAPTLYSQSGTATSRTYYSLPAFFVGIPYNDRLTFGAGVLYDYYGKSIFPTDSILRYFQTTNIVSALDFIPAFGYKVSDQFAFGAGLDFTYANLTLNAVSGFPTVGIPDAQSVNKASGTGFGAHAGILYRPARATILGLTYHTSSYFRLTGKSVFESTPAVASKDYHVKVHTPARIVFSVNQYVTPNLGFIGTIQRIQWRIIQNIEGHNVAYKLGPQSIVLPEVKQPYYLRDTWRFTLGSHYLINPKWIIRGSVSYDQDPTNPHYQIANGDSVLLGASTGYEINKNITLDLSYLHTFNKKQKIHITGSDMINGYTTGFRNAVSVELTYNFV